MRAHSAWVWLAFPAEVGEVPGMPPLIFGYQGLAAGILLAFLMTAAPPPPTADGLPMNAPGVQSPPAPELAWAPESFFTRTNLSQFEVELGPAEYEQLVHWPRKYVPGKVTVDGRVFQHVGVRLKGTGTFDPISKHPNLTLKFNWQVPNQELGGYNKLFLNNARQDPTFLCEFAASSAFADAGLAVPRITHGRVRLNGRDLGPCVVAEAVNKRFLKRHFGSSRGNLYEGVFQDVPGRLEQDNGDSDDRSDLKRLVSAASLPELDQRRKALAGILDVEQFLTYLAAEMIVANWDGYALHQNNYRVYHSPESDRIVFIAHGMDNTFFESGLSLMPPRRSVLAAALLATPEDREQFRLRVAKLLPILLDPSRVHARLSCAVAKMSQGASSAEILAVERKAVLLEGHMLERAEHLRAELADRRPQTPSFDAQGVAHLKGWLAKPDWNESAVERLAVSGTNCLAIAAAKNFCFGSWRLPVWLPVGHYRLEGMVRTSEVRGLPSRTGSGAGVRVLGTMRGNGIQGSGDWTAVQHPFLVTEDCEWVELIAELRAFHGKTLFNPDQFRLVRIGP